VHQGGDELVREHTQGWQAQAKQYIFTTPYYSYTGTVTSGSTTVSAMSSVTGLTSTPTYFMVTGTGIPQDCFITAADAGAATVTLAQEATASGTGVTLTFSQVLFVPPSDFDSQIDRTHWDKSKHWQMLGPETGQQWQWLKSGYISTGPRMRFRVLGGWFQIWPPSGIEDYIGFEYVSNQWVLSAAAQAAGPTPDKASFTVDTDTCIFPDRMMVLGIKHKYYEAKGLGDVFKKDYMDELSIAYANDAGSQTLAMNPQISEVLISWNQVPDSGYGT